MHIAQPHRQCCALLYCICDVTQNWQNEAKPTLVCRSNIYLDGPNILYFIYAAKKLAFLPFSTFRGLNNAGKSIWSDIPFQYLSSINVCTTTSPMPHPIILYIVYMWHRTDKMKQSRPWFLAPMFEPRWPKYIELHLSKQKISFYHFQIDFPGTE